MQVIEQVGSPPPSTACVRWAWPALGSFGRVAVGFVRRTARSSSTAIVAGGGVVGFVSRDPR